MPITSEDSEQIRMDFSSKQRKINESRDSRPIIYYDFLDITTSRYRVVYDGKQTYLRAFINGEFTGGVILFNSLDYQTDLINPIRDLTSEESLSLDEIDSICDRFVAKFQTRG